MKHARHVIASEMAFRQEAWKQNWLSYRMISERPYTDYDFAALVAEKEIGWRPFLELMAEDKAEAEEKKKGLR